jgi:NADH-quinone oxidoreductase subunit L
MGLLASASGSLEFCVNFAVLPLYVDAALSLGGVAVPLLSLANGLLLVGVAAKSAQLGLHTWLADAMEGPTPVSALIHAATMVTAGVYLVLRCSSLFALTPMVGETMALLGAYTAFFGAAVACCQWDLKKVVAYSTCSQLGYMLCACGVGGYGPAFQHLVSHGFFKALLFLAAGVLIHQLAGEQDLRRMGALRPLLPLTTSYFAVGFASLLGLPGTSGYYSKERILDLLCTHSEGTAQLCYNLLWLALVGTSFYSVKVLYYAFGGAIFRGPRATLRSLSLAGRTEVPRWLLPVLTLLVLLSLGAEQLYHPFTTATVSSALEEALGLQTDARVLLVEQGAHGNR